jgi:hypothetical protein
MCSNSLDNLKVAWLCLGAVRRNKSNSSYFFCVVGSLVAICTSSRAAAQQQVNSPPAAAPAVNAESPISDIARATSELPETAASYPHEAQLSTALPSPRVGPIIELEFAQLAASQTRAWSLLGVGTTSVALGGAFALPWLLSRAPADEVSAAAGAMTAAWGAVNTALAIPWLLGFDREYRRIQRWRHARAHSIDWMLHEQQERAHRDSTFFALMCGLDVAYVTAGAFMWQIGERTAGSSPLLTGFGAAILSQGIIGLLIDGWNWGARANDAARLARMMDHGTQSDAQAQQPE